MSAIDNTVSNRNFLATSGFTFRIKKAPNVNFFIQRVNVPAISVKNVDVGNEYVVAPYPGEHLRYEPLNIEFMVDENIENYLELHNWLIGLGKPESYAQYANLSANPSYTGLGVYSDISVFILNSLYAPNYEIVFTDAFPISLSELEFKSTETDKKFITAIASFKYTTYTIESL
jgi:hypothetical protein